MTNERFDEQFPNERHVFEDGDPYNSRRNAIKTFIQEEKNLLLDQAIEELDGLKHYGDCELEICNIDMILDQAISKLKELKT